MEKQHNSPTWQCFQGYLPQSQWGHDNLSQYRGVIYGFIPSSSPLLFHDILTIFQLSSHHYQHYCWWNHHEITINELIAIKSHEILVNHHESTIKSPWLSHFLQTAPSSNGRRLTGPFLGPGSWAGCEDVVENHRGHAQFIPLLLGRAMAGWIAWLHGCYAENYSGAIYIYIYIHIYIYILH